MNLDRISEQLGKPSDGKASKIPPVELWDPPYCGEIDIKIKANGDWFYNNSIFKRLPLVKLFASVIKKEAEDYFLVTPVEKVKITVEQAPFVLTQWQWQDAEQTIMTVRTNVEDEFILNEDHPLGIDEQGDLMVTVRRNLKAKVHRNVFYQWADIAKEVETTKGTELMFTSANCNFSLGSI
ncbi:DUF1285 domain-containing protein [Pseudocolwellia agarivorans]|uniref:DUF1285 domain-containing protein n=1 Tax=Pseudocolwellia agarivorans TaxID=1911682 RepID=UPI003F884A32